MKKIYRFFVVLLILASCSKDDNNNLPELSATVDNDVWNAFTIDTHIVISVPFGEESFSIIAVTKEEQQLELYILSIKSGIYAVTPNSEFFAVYRSKENLNQNSDRYYPTAGEINLAVDSVNQEISGSFNLVLKKYNSYNDSVVITNGSFNNLRYTFLTK
jgi:hypothetical protein